MDVAASYQLQGREECSGDRVPSTTEPPEQCPVEQQMLNITGSDSKEEGNIDGTHLEQLFPLKFIHEDA
jgi:hypothetical protein